MVSIIVDDRDPAIEYSGAWATTNSQGQSLGTPAEYQSTTKQPSEEDSSFSFTFTGTQISVFATLGDTTLSLLATIGGLDPVPITISPTHPEIHQQQVYFSPTLPEAEHTLTITNTDSRAGQSSFFFDYIIYYTSTRKTGQTVFLDDADVGPYSGTWTPMNGNSSDSFFEHTHHATTSSGSSMSMVLDFADGDKLYLYGALGSSSETSNLVLSLLVSIDGASQSPVNPISAPPGTLSTNNLIYQSPPQNASTHIFNFIYTSGPQLGVDYFLLIGGKVISTGSGTGSATGTGLTATLDGTPTMGGASGSESPSAANTNGASWTSSASATSSLARASASLGGVAAGNTGSSAAGSAPSGSAAITTIASLQKHSMDSIAGAIAGFLLLLFLLGGAFIWLRGRRRKAADTRERIAWERQQPQLHELVITGSYFVAGELSRPSAHHRDSLATLTNDELLAADGSTQKGEFPDEKDGYLFYEE